MDREELKLKLINELIDKGLSDDQILEIVEKHFPVDVVAAPAPSTSVTPQQALNRTVAAIKKVNDNLKSAVTTAATDATNKANAAQAAAIADSAAKDTTLHTTITTEQSSKIKYYAGQIAIFNTEKVAPSKFADTTLFDKYELPLGAALLGGNTKTLVNGEVISHTHTQVGHYHKPIDGNGQNYIDVNKVWVGKRIQEVADNPTRFAGVQYTLGTDIPGGKTYISTETPTINSTGGQQNKAYGLQIISHIYVAKKDITFAEMGEN